MSSPGRNRSLPVSDHVDHRLAFLGRGVHQKALSIRGRAVEKDIALDNVAFAPSGKWQISVAVGRQPIWTRNGRELFYLDGNALIVVEIEGDGAALQAGATRQSAR